MITFDQMMPATIWTLALFRNFSTSLRPVSGRVWSSA
jgi:hypothetical protein